MENKQALAYGYCRLSPRFRPKEWEQGEDKRKPWQNEFMSLSAQRDRITAYYKGILEPKGIAWGGFYEDPKASGKVSMENRKAGSKLLHIVERGDHIIFAKLDRAFRKVSDAVCTMDKWREMGTAFHVLDLNIDTTTPAGAMILQLLAVFAEFERTMISMRTKEMAEWRKENGLAAGRAPYGFKIVGPKKKRRLVPFPEMRNIGKHIVEWKARLFSWDEIRRNLNELGILNPEGYFSNKEWTVSAARRAFLGECRLMAEEAGEEKEEK